MFVVVVVTRVVVRVRVELAPTLGLLGRRIKRRAQVLVGGFVSDLAEGLGVVGAYGVGVVVAELGARVVLCRGLRAILEVDRVCLKREGRGEVSGSVRGAIEVGREGNGTSRMRVARKIRVGDRQKLR